MAYKPLSQTVTNGKDREIPSSDAIFDAIAASNPFPSQSGNADKILVTNGTTVSWQYAGLGSGSFPTNSLILGKAKPAGFTSQQSILLGTGTTGDVSTGLNNILIGYNAAPLLATGTTNVIIGNSTVAVAGTTDAVLIGQQATSTSATWPCVAIGKSASAGAFTVSIGNSAVSSTDGSIAIGKSASTTTGGSSGQGLIAIGSGAAVGAANAGDVGSIAIGTSASVTTAAVSGIAIGRSASNAGATGLAIGANAATGSGADNTVVGNAAGLSTSTGANNTIMGRQAGDALTNGADNAFFGKNSGGAVTSGSRNVFVGNSAGSSITTANENIILGNSGGINTNSNIQLGYSQGGSAADAEFIMMGVGVANATDVAGGTSVDRSVLIGRGAGGANTFTSSVLIGVEAGYRNNYAGSKLTHASVIGIGRGTYADGLSNILTMGSQSYPITTAYLGQGARALSGAAIREFTYTSGRVTGTDQFVPRGQVYIAAPAGTGVGVGGSIQFQTASAGSTGATVNPLTTKMELDGEGNLGINAIAHVEKINLNGNIKLYGSLKVNKVGGGLEIATGSNATAGIATILDNQTFVSVSTTAVTANSIILVTNQSSSAAVCVTNKTTGSFRIEHANSVSGNQDCAWFIVNPYNDSDADAFITAAGITNDTQKEAIHTLVKNLKTAGLWTKMKAIYPFVGGTSTTHKYNLKDPNDTDAAFRISFGGTWTHSSDGIVASATTSYADTFLTPSVNLASVSNQHMSVYVKAVSSFPEGSRLMGSGGAADPKFAFGLGSGWAGTIAVNSTSATGTSDTMTDPITRRPGYWIANSSSTGVNLYRRNEKNEIYWVVSGAAATGSLASSKVYINASNDAGVLYLPVRNTYSFATIGEGLSVKNTVDLYYIVEEFQEMLGRRVVG